MIIRIIKSYIGLPKNIHLLFLLEFSLSLIHVAFILILNIFLRKKGFSDPEIASFNSLRFLSALIFALPLGIYIRGKKLKPFFIFSALMVPVTSIFIIQSIHYDINYLINFSFLMWGLSMMIMRVCSLPFIIRNTNPQLKTTTIKTWLDWFPETTFGNFAYSVPFTHKIHFHDVELEVIFLALDRPEDV